MKKLPNAKWLTLEEAVKRRRQLKTDGRSLVITNGAFDLLHPGHLYYLQKASDLADQLWILLNSDESVKMLKGPNRPLQNEAKRANALAALEFVDSIITFQAMRLTAEIEALSPDIYVKAGDYTLDTIDPDERRALEKTGAKIEFLPFLEGYSTTILVEIIYRELGNPFGIE